MSYSFSVRSADAGSAKIAVKEKMDEVVQQQPIHSRDRDIALNAAYGAIETLDTDPECDMVVTMSGYLSWNGDPVKIRSAAVNVNVGLLAKKEA